MIETIKCIYCKESKLNEKELWNREHVIPEAFGKFKNNFVVHDTVCNKCNQKFGDEIDLILSRESYEGKILRYTEWNKDIDNFKEYKKFKSENIVLIQNELSGTIAELTTKDGQMSIVPKSQLLIKEESGYKSYELGSIPHYSYFTKQDIYLSDAKSFIILGSFNAIISEMIEKGFEPNIEHMNEIKEQEITINYSWAIENSFRGISKIAFNYLAHWKGRNYVLRPEFDMIREYIYSGNSSNIIPVYPSNDPILKNTKQPIGHIVTINMIENKNIMISTLTLFNQITYKVLLSPSIEEKKDNIRRGHFFNPFSCEIIELSIH